jgi:putative ABC transport system permease protein
MSIFMTLRIALKALNRNKLRTVLTMLGMIVGVGAVITMVALGKGAQTAIEEQVKAAGTNMININPGNWSQGGVRMGQGASQTLVPADAEAIREVPGVQYVAAGANTRGQIIAGNQNWSTQVQGTDVEFPYIRSWPTRFGAFFTSQDVQVASKVAVLGSVVSDTLFGPDIDPTGQIIRIRNQPFRVIGVMSNKGQSAMGQDQDDVIFTPYTTVMKKLSGTQHLNNITVSASHGRHRAGGRGDPAGAPRPAQADRAATPTTSWSARSRRWPPSAPRRRARWPPSSRRSPASRCWSAASAS